MIQVSKNSMDQDYKQWRTKAMMIVHGRKTRDDILNLLRIKDPVSATAELTVQIVEKMDAAMRKEGVEVDDAVKLFGAKEVIRQLAEVAESAKVFEMSDDLQDLTLAVAVQEYIKREIKAGRVDPRKIRSESLANIKKMPPKLRREMDEGYRKVQGTAAKYRRMIPSSGGK